MPGPLNIPTITTNNLSFGRGIVKMGATGTTPATDIGMVQDASLEVSGSVLDARAGTPEMLIKRYLQVSDAKFTVTGMEWNLENVAKALGAGVTTATQIDLGGDPNLTEYALQFEHRMPSGTTVTLRCWKVVGSGEMTFNFGQDFHEFPMSWDCVRETTDWGNNSLSDRNQYFRIIKA